MPGSTVDDNAGTGADAPTRWADLDGYRVPYLFAGDSGPTVVMVHGASSSRLDWLDSLSGLAKDFRVYAPDLPGFGDATRRDVPHAVRCLAESIAEFLSAVGVRNAAFVGHSIGGRVCLELAHTRPEIVSSLVLIAPLGFGPLSRLGRTLGTVQWAISRLFRTRLPYPILEVELAEDSDAFRDLQCKTMLIWGSRDIYFPMRHAKRAVEMIPDSRMVIYEGGGHPAHRHDSARFTRDLTAFLSDAT